MKLTHPIMQESFAWSCETLFEVVYLHKFEASRQLALKNLIGRAGRSTSKRKFDFGYVIVRGNRRLWVQGASWSHEERRHADHRLWFRQSAMRAGSCDRRGCRGVEQADSCNRSQGHPFILDSVVIPCYTLFRLGIRLQAGRSCKTPSGLFMCYSSGSIL